ncbi:ABC transporter ATP-binding protein [Mobiluncus curtisii]|uniref:ABC transporter, ATP-binding protein n=2 Tax=Mobiluncus curtisii TaxID=2051 RepID=D6ZG40_MOBCV|nr:ABC transporter ATP-binding protein [Mobiluncus curtisii]ADI67598.1 ABC transporter, ATP-binding protein [Mobiluncus curtisii ATCC 43063]QQU08695.1 ABC transporter ATP-binding protein [Mobiluncus curtisii]SQB65062.1 Putative HMP/thiamine import ATP-binding protein YkoD [Mobiluncus curtisii]
MSETLAISCKDLEFRYANSSTSTISGINLDIKKGEFIVISGPSGSGKTTFARCLNGLAPRFWEGEISGTISLNGHEIASLDIGTIGARLATVFQDPRSQFFMTNTDSEIAFGCANQGMSREQTLTRVAAAYQTMAMEDLKNRSLFTLSSGQLQKIAIGSCYATNPDIYLFDEPSANLDLGATKKLTEVLRTLKNRGKTIIVIEHRLFYLTDLLDRFIVFNHGGISATYTRTQTHALDEQSLANHGLRIFDLRKLSCKTSKSQTGTSQLSSEANGIGIDNLRFSRAQRSNKPRAFTLGPINAKAVSGEVIAIVGDNGAGKTTLARICCGLEKESDGKILINGKHHTPTHRLGKATLVVQDSDYQLFSDSVADELSMGTQKLTKTRQEILAQLGLEQFTDTHPQALSRGQKQRLTIACAIASQAQILFLDEPTSGLDKHNMTVVAQLVKDMASSGRLVFLISHDFEFLCACATRIWVMHEGKIIKDQSMSDQAMAVLRGQWNEKVKTGGLS